ncbi:MAG: helix-turn-helix transcriptional regulator [Alphaproteobacteria bacterium]|nr:helix-turn-helix transcriptional regulator [Alphaproteobacteria bacterium]
MTQHTKHEPIESGSNNIFADLGLSNPEEHLAKATLAIQIAKIIKERGLSQSAAAAILGIDQPKVSALMRGQLKNFSLDRLCRFLNHFDRDVDIIVRNKSCNHAHGETHVIFHESAVIETSSARA